MKIYFLLLFIIFFSCSNKNDQIKSNSYTISDNDSNQLNFEINHEEIVDGTYCAEVNYYYYNTGTSSTYNLDVEVENGELVQINWPNEGWLDDSHFNPTDISDGSCSFTSDAGYDYTVTLLDKGGCGYSKSNSSTFRQEPDLYEESNSDEQDDFDSSFDENDE